MHEIGNLRLVYKEVVELWPNYKKFYFWRLRNPACGDLAESNQIENKNSENGEYDFSAVWIGAILGNGYAIQGEKYVGFTAGEWNDNKVSPQELHFMFIML